MNNFAYLVNHPKKGAKVFCPTNIYWAGNAAIQAIDYAEGLVPVTIISAQSEFLATPIMVTTEPILPAPELLETHPLG